MGVVDCRRFRGVRVGVRVGDMLGLREGGNIGGREGWCVGERGRVGDRALRRTCGMETGTGSGDEERTKGGFMADVASS